MKKNNKKIKIAIVYDAIYPYIKGGAEKRNYELSKQLTRVGYEVHMYGMRLWGDNKIIKKDGIYLHGISEPKKLYTKKGRRSIWQAVYFGFSCFKLLKEDFDILEVNHMPFFSLFSAKIVALLKRKKLYTTWNEVWGKKYWKQYLGQLGTIAYVIEWLSARMPDEIIAVSEYTKNRLIEDLKVKTNIVVVPNGIDFELIQKIKPSKEKIDVIFAGRLLSHKNIDLLIKSINSLKKTHPNIKTLIIGNGPEKPKLQELIKELKLNNNVKIIDFLDSHDDLYGLFKSAKLFAFPSSREGFGISALEANACGIPFITINHKDNATMYLVGKNGNGYSTNFSIASFAKQIGLILSANKYKDKKVYINFAKNFNWENIFLQNQYIYKNY